MVHVTLGFNLIGRGRKKKRKEKWGGREVGRKEGRSEQAMGKKERALAKKASPTHTDSASSRETTFYM